MLKGVYEQYRGACMLLLRQENEAVVFMGTAFMVHPEGYMLTAAHLLNDMREVMVAPRNFEDEFAPPWSETVTPMAATVCAMDKEHDVALLRFKDVHELSMPDHVIGVPEEIPMGSQVACLGYPFGHYKVFNQFIQGGIVTSKMRSRNDTNLFLFDTPLNDGLRGGPLVNVYDGRIIGVAGGWFQPEDAMGLPLDETSAARRIFGYAMSTEYGTRLLEAEGVEAV